MMTMPSAIELYDKLRAAPDDATRARIIAEAFDALEHRYPGLNDIATATQVTETELRLRQAIEQVKADLTVETEKIRAELKTEIERFRADAAAESEKVRADLSLEIEKLRADLTEKIARTQTTLIKWSFLFWLSQIGVGLLILTRLWHH